MGDFTTLTGTDNKHVSVIASDVVLRDAYITLYAADTQWQKDVRVLVGIFLTRI